MNFTGILIGAGTFLIIGALHPVVIKAEYYFGKNIWPVFLVGGIVCVGLSALMHSAVIATLLAVLGFSLFWSIRELFEQEQRVAKGWYPANPHRKAIRLAKPEPPLTESREQ